MVCRASSTESSLGRAGTETRSGPLETTTVTAAPLRSCASAAGFCRITTPLATVSLKAVRGVTLNPAFPRTFRASAKVLFTTPGTVTMGGPVDT